jgi:hypothetical protein
LSPFVIKTKFESSIFLQINSIQNQKSDSNFLFEQTSCGVISEPSANNLMVQIFQDWLILLENVAGFPCPPNAKILTFHQTALNGDDAALPVKLPLVKWLSCTLWLLFCYKLNVVVSHIGENIKSFPYLPSKNLPFYAQ